ncbi:hypothetical protein HK405_003541 [Cladochytrium tenue]|nr:hypothetical protein HK405_003541 [Cladochytrium tenue]
MDHKEEQAQEVEALESIFADDYELLDAGPPACFRLRVRSEEPLPPPSGPDDPAADDEDDEDDDDGDDDGEDDDDDNDQGNADDDALPFVWLRVRYTPTYPETAPELAIDLPPPPRRRGHQRQRRQHGRLTPSDAAALQAEAARLADEQLGLAMAFGVHSGVKDALEDLARRRVAELDAATERRRAEEEEKERRAAEARRGTPVTKDAFLDWRVRFLAEARGHPADVPVAGAAAAAATNAAAAAAAAAARPTGRQLFERDRSLAKSDVALMQDGDETVTFDRALFESEAAAAGLDSDDDDDAPNAVLASFEDDE